MVFENAVPQLLREYPLVAIGGIDMERLPEVMSSGVGSVAVVRALIAAKDPEAEAKQLSDTIHAFNHRKHAKSAL
jgi:thiamine-phosphate pyrophosphorylase